VAASKSLSDMLGFFAMVTKSCSAEEILVFVTDHHDSHLCGIVPYGSNLRTNIESFDFDVRFSFGLPRLSQVTLYTPDYLSFIVMTHVTGISLPKLILDE
jgi:hypothetical protein